MVVPEAGGAGDCVVLVHGLGRGPLSLKRVEWTLRRHGYRVVNVSLPTRRGSVQWLAEEYLSPVISKLPTDARRVDFVTHSLGGIVLREYLSKQPIAKLGRVVMLGTPNRGSEVVDVLRRHRAGRWILGPAGCELGTAETDLPRRLGPVPFELGVIAGNRSMEPYLSQWISGPNDGKVSVANAKVEGMKDFLTVHHSHTFMMWRSDVLVQIIAFLKNGSFNISGA